MTIKNVSIKDRIAILYSLTFTLLIALVFSIIYFLVDYTVYKALRSNLTEELAHHTNYVKDQHPFQQFVEENEWEEKEHTDLEVNPVFITIYSKNMDVVEQSPNLREHHLKWRQDKSSNQFYETTIDDYSIVSVQAELMNQEAIVGYIVIGMSTKNTQFVMDYLRIALLILFPISVVVLFYLSRFIAGKGIQPVFEIIDQTQQITENKLNTRIPLPFYQDEIYRLTVSVNELLDRVENRLKTETQFSADASHELRTPLSIIKGTLEILVRKERTEEAYKDKINYSLKQLDRLNDLVEQLLFLSRVENESIQPNYQKFALEMAVLDSIERYASLIKQKEIYLDYNFSTSFPINSEPEFLSIILDNIISNAIKYVGQKGRITIVLHKTKTAIYCEITDDGLGMNQADLDYIQQRYYRSSEVLNRHIQGTGLGLSIAYKLAKVGGIHLKIKSKKDQGTTVILCFPKHSF